MPNKNNKKALHPWKSPYDLDLALARKIHSGYEFPVLEDVSDLPGVETDENIIAYHRAKYDRIEAEEDLFT